MAVTKSELDESVDPSLCGLAPTQSQMDLFLDTLCARNKQRAANFNQSEEAMSRVTASAVFFSGASQLRHRLHERGFASTRFDDFETASKSMRFGSVYTVPFSPENPSRDGISELCTTC